MIQNCSFLQVFDNSGAIYVKCFKTYKYHNNRYFNFIIKVSVRKYRMHKKVVTKKGQVFNALIIKTKTNRPRFNGQKIVFDKNGCIIINNINFRNKKTRNKINMLSSTTFGLALKEFRLYSIKININTINII
jgi:large subunit ribosomal protein L14